MGQTRKLKKYWGYHLIVEAGGCDPEALRSKKTITDFSKKLVKEIDMIAYGKPMIHNFGKGDKKGFSLVQLIETSNITAHCVEETNDIYLDIFSCKSFSPRDAIAVFKEFFSPQKIRVRFLKRQAPHV